MPSDHSFDIVSKVDLQEMDNAVNQVIKEIGQRFDFKGSKSGITLNKTDNKLELASDDEFKLTSLKGILESKLIKRGISIKSLTYGKLETAFEGTVRQTAEIAQGISQDKAKPITQSIRDMKLKVQPNIQADQIRVTARQIDDLQTVMGALKAADFGIPLQFINFR